MTTPAIPTITDYRLPRGQDLPDNRVDWRPDPRRAALLVHDMQQYFVDTFGSGSSMATDLVANSRALLEAARRAGLPVAHTAQAGGADPAERGLLADFWGPGMTADPQHTRIVAGLEPAVSDLRITKRRYSAFHRSGLADWLRTNGRDQLIICGVYAHIGCMITAFDAYARDVQPFLVSDAVADFTEQEHHLALQLVARRCGAVADTGTVTALLSGEVRPLTPTTKETTSS